VNFGPLAAEIDWRVSGTPANFNGFRVLALLLQWRSSTEVNQTLHYIWPSAGLVRYIYILGAVAPWRNFATWKIHFVSIAQVCQATPSQLRHVWTIRKDLLNINMSPDVLTICWTAAINGWDRTSPNLCTMFGRLLCWYTANTESIKSHYNLAHNFAKCWLIFRILSQTDSLVNLQQNRH